MKLYMVRHGQSETNLARKFTGWAQVSLTEQGFADARRAGAYLQGKNFDRIYSSDLKRAIQTAQTAIPGCEPIQLACLREIDVGDLSMRTFDECLAKYGEGYMEHRRALNFVPFGGENQQMMKERIASFMRMLEEDPCEQAVAFAHAGTLNTALEYVVGGLDRGHVHCVNGSVAAFSYANGRWYLDGWGLGC